METQKIVNLLNGSDYENSKFATKKWYVIGSESKGVYSHENPIKFLLSSLESRLCNYYDTYILDQKITDLLCKQNALFAELKSQDL